MDIENLLCVRVSNKGYEVFGTSFNPNEINEEEFLSKFSLGGIDEDEESDDDKKDISDYSINSEIFFDDMGFGVEFSYYTIYGNDSLPSDVKVIELEKKESYKNMINPLEGEICVLWFYYQDNTRIYYWNDIEDFDIKKLKIYCSTRINEIESKEYKLFSGLTYDDKDPDDEEYESQPGPGLDGPYTF
jgi:hypothetical protein